MKGSRGQNPRIWQGNDGEHRASFEVTARTVKFLGRREGNGGAPVGEPPPDGYEERKTFCHFRRDRSSPAHN